MRTLIAAEYKAQLNRTVDTSGWKVVYRKDIPRQPPETNQVDCGVFAMMGVVCFILYIHLRARILPQPLPPAFRPAHSQLSERGE